MDTEEKNKIESIAMNGHEITYDIHGDADGPALVLITGWHNDHRLFKRIVEPLAKQHKVIRVNYRGHTDPLNYVGDFGPSDQADDVIGVLNALKIDQVIPISNSHGGWVNMEITDRLGIERVPQSVVVDWIMVDAIAIPEFLKGLQLGKNPNTWFKASREFYALWKNGTNNRDVIDHIDIEMAAFGFEMWNLCCRKIEEAYFKWGTPLKRMKALEEKRRIMHIYTQAPVEGYEDVQRDFADENPWFDFKIIEGDTHFPTLESPDAFVKHVNDFVAAHSSARHQ